MTGGNPPFVKATLECILNLNRFHADRALRGFQLSVARRGYFFCLSPFTGQQVRPVAHYLLPRTGVHYYFGGSFPFVLTTGSLKDGFPLLCLVTQDEIFWISEHPQLDLARHAQSLLADAPPPVVEPTRQSQVHIGDPNFAHCIWNEYPALLALLDQTTDFTCQIAFDPLGVLRKSCDATGTPYHAGPELSPTRGWSSAPVVFPGSTFCNAAAMTAAHRLMAPPHRTHSTGAPRIWLTIRDKGRTMENQEAFLCAMIRAFHDRDPDTVFLLDGFSCPMDFSGAHYDPLRPKFAARIAGARAITARLRSRLPGVNIKELTGAPLQKALCEIAKCSFYVSHAGTMQHKPAWFYPVPGIIHGNRASLSRAALRWAGRMVEDTIAPAGLSPDIVQDTKVRGLPVHNDRNRDYVVTDLHAATAQVLAHYDATRTISPMTAAG